MANQVNKDAIVRFLAGYETDLSGVTIENGTVYFALKPDPLNSSNTIGSIYLDANGKRILMSGESLAALDAMGDKIVSKYIKSVDFANNTGAQGKLTYTKGDNTPVDVNVPSASASAAGFVTTGAQTFAGIKTFDNPIIPLQGSYIHSATGTAGTVGYVKIATFKISGSYQNMPMVLELVDRVRKGSCVLNIQFQNVNSSDPTLATFTYEGVDYNCYMYKSASGTWDLYVQKGEGHGQPTVVRFHKSPYMSKVAVTWTNVHADAAPSGATKAVLGGNVAYASKAGSADTATKDGSGNNIQTTYLRDLTFENTASDFKIWGVKGNNSDGTKIAIPAATTALAGLISTTAQTFAGVKTFEGFVYGGMSESTANAARSLWFMSGTKGTPTYNDDLTYNPSTKTLVATNITGTVTKAIGDGQGNNIQSTYLKDIEGTSSTTTYTIKGITGNGGDSPSSAIIPAATDAVAGLVTTGAQTFGGTKTFKGFVYSGIAADTTTTSGRSIWFMSGTKGTPVYSSKFTYTPSTDTVTAANFNGLAAKATGDGNGNKITTTYLKNIEVLSTDNHKLTLIKGDNSSTNITLGFVLKAGDTMTGQLRLDGGVLVDTDSGNKPFIISRTGATTEATSIYQDDSNLVFNMVNDEASATMKFNMKVTDTETGGGANAAEKAITFTMTKSAGTTITADKFTGLAAKATADSAGNNILDKYVSTIGKGTHSATAFSIKAYDGNGNDQSEVSLPVDTTGALASLIINGAQTLVGLKTFSTGITIPTKEFRYTGIEQGTADAARVVWFADSGEKGKPVYHTAFTYNPASQTLTVKNITGTITNATSDSAGNVILDKYLSSIAITSHTANTWAFTAYNGRGNDVAVINAPVDISGALATLVINGAQTFQGSKTFSSDVVLSGDNTNLQKAGSSVSWYQGRNTAIIKTTSYKGYNAAYSLKTTSGDWSVGVYSDNKLYWSYITDTNYNADTNTKSAEMILDTTSKLTLNSVFAKTRINIGSENSSYAFYNASTSYFADHLYTSNSATLIQSQNDTSNYTTILKWKKVNPSSLKYLPHMGQHNTGGNASYPGGIAIVPYATATDPWGKQVGLYIQYGAMYLDGKEIFTANSYTTLDNRYVNVSGDTMTGALTVQGATTLATLTANGATQLKSTLVVTGTTTLNSVLYANLGIEAKGNIVPVEGDLTQSVGNGVTGNGWMFYGRLGSWHPQKKVRPSSANITARGDASLSYFLADVSAMTDAKLPATDSHIINMEWDTTAGWTAQMAFPTSNNNVQWRTQNGSPDWSGAGDWRTFIDSKNYKSFLDGTYVNTAGDTMTGNLTVPALIAQNRIDTPILFATNYISIGVENANYGLYNSKKTYLSDTVEMGSSLTVAGATTLNSTLAVSGNTTISGTLTAKKQIYTSFKNAVATGSYQASATTIENLIAEVRYSSGVMGSVNITTTYTSPTTGQVIAAGWYNFEYIPHRSGGANGAASGDNCNYGTLLLYGMTMSSQHWRIRFASEKIAEVRRIWNDGDALRDEAGEVIRSTYLRDVELTQTTATDKKSSRIYLTKVKGNNDTTTIEALANRLHSHDIRNLDPTPSATPLGLYLRFSQGANHATIKNVDNSTYLGIASWRAYGGNVDGGSDLTGGNPFEIAYTQQGNLWTRVGTSATAWGTWVQLLSSANYARTLDPIYVNVTGDTMTGDLTVPNLIANTKITTPILFASNYITIGTDTSGYGLYNAKTSYFADQVTTAGLLYATGGVYSNKAATAVASFWWNKSGTNWGGIGYNGVSNENYFGPCNGSGNWVDAETDTWTFKGQLKTTNDAHIYGTLRIDPSLGNYQEGIRIAATDTEWATIALGTTAAAGTHAKQWSIHRKNDGNFCIAHGESSGTSGLFINTSNKIGMGTITPSYKLHVVGDIYANDGWLRTNGARGWYNETYGGGIYMEDTTWVRTYGDKQFYCSNVIASGTRIYVGYDSGVANSISCSGWFRSNGSTGWYNATYGGGWYQTDSTWVKVHGDKGIYTGGSQYLGGNLEIGGTIKGYGHSSSWIAGRDNALLRMTSINGYSPVISAKTTTGSWELGTYNESSFQDMLIFSYASDANYNAGTNSTTTTVRVKSNGTIMGAAWNDYAEYRQTKVEIEPGRSVIETGRGDLVLATERLQPGGNIVSDTFGFSIGDTEQAQTPLAIAGRVLAYPFEDKNSFEPGDAVCTGPNGTVSKMTREEIWQYPDRIIGTVSEIPDYEVWGSGNVKVNGRIWIKVR